MGSLLILLQVNPPRGFFMENVWDRISFEALQPANNYPLAKDSQ
jgi:hypothetical protein